MLVGHLFRHFILSPRAGALVRKISLLSMIGIAVSVMAFVVVLSVMNGMNVSIKKRILGLEPHLSIQVAGITTGEGLESHPVFSRIKEDPTNQAHVFESQDVIIRTQDGQFRGGIARGVSEASLENFLRQLGSLNQEGNSTFKLEDIPEEGEVLMGYDLAQTLGVFEGDYVTIVSPSGLLLPAGEVPALERVRVKRVIVTTLADVDSQNIFYQRNMALSRIKDSGTVSLGIDVWLADPNRLERVQADLEKFDGVQIQNWMQKNSSLLFALKLEKLSIGSFLGLAGMVAASSILTVLALLLSQKRRDIAVLRTLGLSSKETVKTFTLLGFLLASVGVVSGLVLGLSIGYYIQFNPIQLGHSEIYYDPTLPAQVDLGMVFWVLIVSASIAALGSYLPSRAASEVNTSEALKMK